MGGTTTAALVSTFTQLQGLTNAQWLGRLQLAWVRSDRIESIVPERKEKVKVIDIRVRTTEELAF